MAYFSELIQLKLRSRLRSPQAIEDVRQETFTRVFAALHGGKSPPARPPRRLCKLHVQQRFARALPCLIPRQFARRRRSGGDFPAISIDLLGALAAKQLGEKIREILEEMPERDRRLLREVFLEERDKDAVCRDFGVDRDYLRVLLHRAKLSFKSLYLKNMAARPPGSMAAEKL